MSAHDLLLLSNSNMFGMKPLEHAAEAIAAFLGERRVLFAPYALRDHDGYTAGIEAALTPFGVAVTGLHRASDPRATIESAEVLLVGGGNSFRLLQAFQRLGLIDVVRRRVESGALRYLGSSAGSNLACPTIRTTNDMPIVQPASFGALGLVPFQINPHYQDANPDAMHVGETREHRLLEFLEENDVPILGMREGAWLRRCGRQLHLGGRTGARLFKRGAEPQEFGEGADLSWLLELPARFDERT
ncbi:MAG TPA: dipeptidase PepE [Steroidobacteraceae bacterium]|nr:dipeptidase PepE [Steroidobacteraceae bacterium]